MLCQVNCVDYKARKVGKDMIYLEIVVEKDNQKGILIGKVGHMPPGCRAACRSSSAKWAATDRTTVQLGSLG